MEDKKLNVGGLLSMILSIIGIFVGGLPCGIAGSIIGLLSLLGAGEEYGKGMAITGLVIGIVDIICVVSALRMLGY